MPKQHPKTSGIKKKGKKKIRGNQQLKGTKGSAVNYITRNQAIKKIQISLPEFRKLCILKGIYPREPPRAPKGKDKTYYYRKDILFLQHDPLLKKFAERRVWKRKVKKAKDKKMPSQIAQLRKHKPKYSLNHIIKERYPTFIDALRDLDDALSMVFLFSSMPATELVRPYIVGNCRKLITEFEYYIMKSHSLRKVFISIKGIYYQAEIRAQNITWVVPFRFTPQIRTKEVDYRVMLSFLEFYEVLVGFVNFKLFQSLGLSYPPKFLASQLKMANDLETIASDGAPIGAPVEEEVKQQSKSEVELIKKKQQESRARLSTLSKALNKIKASESSTEESIDEVEPDLDDNEDNKSEPQEDEEFANDEVNQRRKEQSVFENLFGKCHFWLGREVPRESLMFIIKSFGGRVSWDNTGNEKDESITHQIVDRNPNTQYSVMIREYILPQWVYDCVNVRMLIPTEEYKPGAKLPPHLSPFVDDYRDGYVPEYRKKLDALYKEVNGIPSVTTASVALPGEESESDEEERFAEDLAKEQNATYEPTKKKLQKLSQQQQKEADETEQKETAESLLPRKNRRLLQRIKYSRKMKEDQISKLEEKRRRLESGDAKVVSKSILVYETQE